MTAADLAAAVKARRVELGWSQTAVAEKAGISQFSVSRLERATGKDPRGVTLAGLDAAFGWPAGTAGNLHGRHGDLAVPAPRPAPAVLNPPKTSRPARRNWLCGNCHRTGTCPMGACTDLRVRVRRVLVDHLTAQQVRAKPFPELIEALLDDLVPRNEAVAR